MADICRWGFMSTAGIGRKNWKAIRHAGNAVVGAVASRDLDKARQFIATNQADCPFDKEPEAVGDYDELLNHGGIDAVYIPLPTALRHRWVIRAAEAGKHVLCEKPCASNMQELHEMTAACKANGVQFMDGVMFMHSTRLPAMKTVLEDKAHIGDLRRIAIQFSFCGPEAFFRTDIRTHSGLEPQGCLGDLGWYCIRQTLWAMNGELPREVFGRILAEGKQPNSPGNVPLEFSAEMFFESGVSASFYCSFITEHQQFVRFSGSKGYLQLDDFVLPYLGSELSFDVANHAFVVRGCDFNMERHVQKHQVQEYANGWPTAQESRMIRCFSENVLGKRVDESWSRWSLLTQSVLDACLESAQTGKSVRPVRV